MLRSRGQTDLEAETLASASALASASWPRPRAFGLGLTSVLLTWRRHCAIQCKYVLLNPHSLQRRKLASVCSIWPRTGFGLLNLASKIVLSNASMYSLYPFRGCITVTFITKTWLSTLLFAMCSY